LYQAKEAAQDIVNRDQSGTSGAELAKNIGGDCSAYWQEVQGFTTRFNQAMDQDFNSAKVVGSLYELVRCINRLTVQKPVKKRGALLLQPALEAFELCGRVLGIGGADPTAFFDALKSQRMAAQGTEVAEVEALITARCEARSQKDWAEADRIRETLDALHVVVMDRPEGSTWRARVD
jgi:cysteinyl-tRNA synthetase